MPRLWNDTIESHRREVRDAIMQTAAALVFEHGLRAVTMAQIAERAGIGRATLYKYFPDVDAILHAWHAQQVDKHIRQLTEIRDAAGDPGKRLLAVLTNYAHIVQQTRSHDTELVTFLHPENQIADAHQQLRELIRQLIKECAQSSQVRDDIDPAELAGYCLHALGAAAILPTTAAIDRLVAITLDGLRPNA